MLQSAAAAASRTLRAAARTTRAAAPELTLEQWGQLRGNKLYTQLKSTFPKNPNADDLRVAVMNFNQLEIPLSDAGMVKWLNEVAPKAVARSPVDDKISFFTQASASGVPNKTIDAWMPEGWGKMGRINSPLVTNAADLLAFQKRLEGAFPRSKIFSVPLMGSMLAIPTRGAPVSLTAEGQKLTMVHGAKTATTSVPLGASKAKLDAIVADLASKTR